MRSNHPAGIPQHSQPTNGISEADIDEVLLEFDNNPREAIRGLLHDLDVLAQDRDHAVSFGFVRGTVWRRKTNARV